MLGAYIWHVRADRRPFAATNVHENHADSLQRGAMAPPVTASKQSQPWRFGRAGSGLSIFIFLLMQFLLTEHERTVLLLVMIFALVLVVALAFILKALRGTSG
jgi:hypothetical protein